MQTSFSRNPHGVQTPMFRPRNAHKRASIRSRMPYLFQSATFPTNPRCAAVRVLRRVGMHLQLSALRVPVEKSTWTTSLCGLPMQVEGGIFGEKFGEIFAIKPASKHANHPSQEGGIFVNYLPATRGRHNKWSSNNPSIPGGIFAA